MKCIDVVNIAGLIALKQGDERLALEYARWAEADVDEVKKVLDRAERKLIRFSRRK